MRTIDLLYKSSIPSSTLDDDIQEISKALGFKYVISLESKTTYLIIHLYNNDHKNLLEISLYAESFKETFNKLDVRGYGAIAAVDWNGEEDMLIPFLRELFKKYPEMIVYNEEAVPQNRNSAAYYKSDIDNFKGELPYMLFDKLPAKRF